MENSLMAEIGNWNRQENKFRELFSEEAIKDREFQKMKLAEYHRLYYKYSGSALSTDEKAILTVLRFQRRKMEKVLYPGLITRLVRRAFSRLGHLLWNRREPSDQKNTEQSYAYHTIPVSTNVDNGQANGMDQQHRVKRYGQDLGKRNNHRQHKGQSL